MADVPRSEVEASEQEGRQREQSLRAPERFYPRPQDVLADPSLSLAEKKELLRNWQVALQGRGGSLGEPRMDHNPEDDEAVRALQQALRQLGAD